VRGSPSKQAPRPHSSTAAGDWLTTQTAGGRGTLAGLTALGAAGSQNAHSGPNVPVTTSAAPASSPAAGHIWRRIERESTLGALWTIGGQEGAQLSQPRVAVLGL
jgi:hypothetical protein